MSAIDSGFFGGDLEAFNTIPERKRLRTPVPLRDAYTTPPEVGDLSAPGSLIYRHAPEMRFKFARMDEDGTPHARRSYMLALTKGYHVCMAEDWIVADDLKEMIRSETGTETGRLTLMGESKSPTIFLYQAESDHDRHRRILLRNSDDVQRTYEERMAATADKVGAEITFETDEDEEDAAPPRRGRGRPRKT